MAPGTMQQSTPALIEALRQPQAWPHPVTEFSIIQTHISWVLLTGEFAYKMKRPLNLGFLDFSTLQKRRDACLEEVRLNHRTAPDMYLDVVAICGTDQSPRVLSLDEAGEDVIEYAVRMRQFAQRDKLNNAIADDHLELRDMDRLAQHVAGFHGAIPRARENDPWNGYPWIARLCRDNFETLAPLVDDAREADTLEQVRTWSNETLEQLRPLIEKRKQQGFVRECHGDLHLSNIVRSGNDFAAFDCIEFDPALRWMDVASEIGFLVMDLAVRQRTDLGWRFLNRYLEMSGDYGAAELLRLYIVYASMVRAKIAGIRAEQEAEGNTVYMEQARHYRSHLGLAERASRPRRPLLLLTHGVSGAGKSWLSAQLACALPAIRVVSDIERKRIHGLLPGQSSDSPVGGGIYDDQADQATYDRLYECARSILGGDFDCIVDASFLSQQQRQRFIHLAVELGGQPLIAECIASDSVLRDRLMQRAWDGADASEADWAVLQHQIQHRDPLTDQERRITVSFDGTEAIDALRAAGTIWQKLGRVSE